MEGKNSPKELKFSDLCSSTAQRHCPRWAQKSQTTLAHASGRLPQQRHGIGWQPLAGPGSLSESTTMSVTLRSLHRRVRGEA